MGTEEFWDNYINRDTLEIFDLTCDFFSKELPQDFIENYEVGEVVLETRGHQEDAKNFDNVFKFTEILRNKHPNLYKEHFQYFDDFYVDYFCFQQDELKVREAFANFIKNPVQHYDKYLVEFNRILCYQYSEILDEAVSEDFDIVSESDELIGNAEYDLAKYQLFNILENVFKKGKEEFDIGIFSEEISKFNLDPGDEYLSSIERGLFEPQLEAEELKSTFLKDKNSLIFTLEDYFLKWMYKKGFPFYLSGWIWLSMLSFWVENIKEKKFNANTFFDIQTISFERYLAKLSNNFFLDTTSEMIALLWGSVYIYEFLYKYEFINKSAFKDFIDISRTLKGKAIGQFTTRLWNSNFVHCWEKPDCISETEFLEEEKIFRKSLSLKPNDFATLRNEISEELSNIGELSDFIIEGGKESENTPDWDLDMFDDLPSPSNEMERIETEDNSSIRYEPVRTEKKIGRNDPCPCGSGKKYKKCCGKN